MIVAAIAASHAPFIVGAPEKADPKQAQRFFAGYREAARRLGDAKPDAILIVTAEHFTNFLTVVPPFHIHLGESAFGPVEESLGIEQRHVPNAPHLARELLDAALASGVDMAFGHHLDLDHGSMVPLHLLGVAPHTPVIPLIVNCLIDPMPSYLRCAAVGRALRESLTSMDARIGLVAAGGLSHWPGMPQAGRISPAWDRRVLDRLADGRDVLLDPPEDPDMGPGAEELRAWTIVAEAASVTQAEVLAYEPIIDWSTGCAVVDLMPHGSAMLP